MRPSPSGLLCAALALGIAVPAAQAQNKDKEKDKSSASSSDRAARGRVLTFALGGGRSPRAALGIGTNGGGKRDTLGLLITSIVSGSPAEKAGLEEGDRIAAINGTNLTLSPADAGQPDMGGILMRRLTRELQKVEPGDEVKLEIWHGGSEKTVTVKTAEQAQLTGRSVVSLRSDADDRAVVGLNTSSTGSVRDTLGLFIASVQADGPAEKAGIIEGDRIASVNGVDLRVGSEDAGDPYVAQAKQQRLIRELGKLDAGDAAELKVWHDGSYRTISVKTAKSSDVYPQNNRFRFQFGGDGMTIVSPGLAPMPPMPAMPAMPAMPPMASMERARVMSAELAPMMAKVQQAQREGERAVVRARRGFERARAAEGARMRFNGGEYYMSNAPRGRISNLSNGQSALYTALSGIDRGGAGFSLGGLRLTTVNEDLASYFGEGSEKGLLVLSASNHWKDLEPGDIILSVNGTPVAEGDHARVSLSTDEDTTFEILRKGKRMRVKVAGD